MTNKGLLKTVAEIDRQNREKFEKEKEARAKETRTPGGLRRLAILPSVPYLIKFLHPFNKGFDVKVHLTKGKNSCHELCREHYNEECPICLMDNPDYEGSKCFPMTVRCMIGWVLNDVDQSFEVKLGNRTEIRKKKALKLIEIPTGKNELNLSTFQEANRMGYFENVFWRIERIKGEGFQSPKSVLPEEVPGLLGREVSLRIPEEHLEIRNMDNVDIFALAMQSFDNVDWDKFGLEDPSKKEETSAPPTGEAKGSPEASGSSVAASADMGASGSKSKKKNVDKSVLRDAEKAAEYLDL